MRKLSDGLSRREVFASHALCALIGRSDVNPNGSFPKGLPVELAESAVKFADALVEELKKKEASGEDVVAR